MTTDPNILTPVPNIAPPNQLKDWMYKNLLTLVMLIAGGIGAVYLFGYRLDAVEKQVRSLQESMKMQTRVIGRMQLDVSVICAQVADDPLRDCKTSRGD